MSLRFRPRTISSLSNRILKRGEIAFIDDDSTLRIGDGVTTTAGLPPIGGGGALPNGSISRPKLDAQVGGVIDDAVTGAELGPSVATLLKNTAGQSLTIDPDGRIQLPSPSALAPKLVPFTGFIAGALVEGQVTTPQIRLPAGRIVKVDGNANAGPGTQDAILNVQLDGAYVLTGEDRVAIPAGEGVRKFAKAMDVIHADGTLLRYGCEQTGLGVAGSWSAVVPAANGTTIGAAGQLGTVTGGDLPVPRPAEAVTDDIQEVLFWHSDYLQDRSAALPMVGSGGEWTLGWSLQIPGNTGKAYKFWRRIAAGSVDSTFVNPAGTGSRYALTRLIRGARKTGSPYDGAAQVVGDSNATDTNQTLPATPTPAAPGRIALGYSVTSAGVPRTWPAGWTAQGSSSRMDMGYRVLTDSSPIAQGIITLGSAAAGVAATELLAPQYGGPGADVQITAWVELA